MFLGCMVKQAEVPRWVTDIAMPVGGATLGGGMAWHLGGQNVDRKGRPVHTSPLARMYGAVPMAIGGGMAGAGLGSAVRRMQPVPAGETFVGRTMREAPAARPSPRPSPAPAAEPTPPRSSRRRSNLEF